MDFWLKKRSPLSYIRRRNLDIDFGFILVDNGEFILHINKLYTLGLRNTLSVYIIGVVVKKIK